MVYHESVIHAERTSMLQEKRNTSHIRVSEEILWEKVLYGSR